MASLKVIMAKLINKLYCVKYLDSPLLSQANLFQIVNSLIFIIIQTIFLSIQILKK